MTASLGTLRHAVIVFVVALLTTGAVAQVNPVYVDDSPLAREMFARATDHAEDNLGEAVRLLQELLDEFPNRLIAVSDDSGDRYVTVRSRVLQTLRDSPRMLERYRQSERTRAGRLLEAGSYEQLATSRPLTTPGLEALLRLAQANLERARFNAALHWLDEATGHPDLANGENLPAEHDRRAAHAWHMIGLAALHQSDRPRVIRAIEELERIGRRAEPLHEHLAERHHRTQVDDHHTRPHQPRTGRSVFDHTFAVGLEELVAEEIWSLPMNDSLAARRDRNTAPDRPILGRSLRASIEEGHLLTTAPTVRGNVVYINQGHRVSAVDRMSGAAVWDHDFVDRQSVSVIDRDDEQPRDLNIVTLQGNALVTLTGHAYGTGRSSDGRLVRLDAKTGQLVWAQPIDTLRTPDGDLDDLFPHSTPAIVDDQVLVLARRVSRQSLSSTYLLSFDLETGSPRWVRHIVSSSATRRATRAFSTLTIHEGDAYISAPVGATARINAATGRVRWLNRFPVGINPQPAEQSQRPWELIAPIVLDDHVICFEPGLRHIAVLDRSTGVQHRRIDATERDGWNHPSYLITGRQFIISIGRDIRAFDPDDLERPVWQLPSEDNHRPSVVDEDTGRSAPITWRGPYEPYGRIQLARSLEVDDGTSLVPQGNSSQDTSWLIIPSRDGVRIVEEDSGHIAAHLPIRNAGNVIAGDAQLLVAGNESLKAYMSLSRAEQLMRERVAQRPNDPAPALGLARLGVRVGRFELVMEASDLAMQSIASAMNRGGRAARDAEQQRDELTRLLLETDAEHIASTRDEAESLFALIDRVVETPEQRVAATLTRGDWYADRDPGRAIESWQRILADRDLSRVLWERPDRTLIEADRDPIDASLIRPASVVARQRMAELIAEHGDGVYATQAEYARMRVETMIENSQTTPDRLLDLARQFPYAEAAITAGIEAADRLVAQREVDRALDTFAETYRLTEPLLFSTDDAEGVWADRSRTGTRASDERYFRRLEVLARYVELAARHDRRDTAIDMLHYMRDRYAEGGFEEADAPPGSESEGEGRPFSERASALLARHGARLRDLQTPGNRTHPTVGDPNGRAPVLDGRLIPMVDPSFAGQDFFGRGGWSGRHPLPPNDAFLLHAGGGGAVKLMRVNGGDDAGSGRALVAAWRQPLEGRDPQVVLWTDEQVLMHHVDPDGASRVVSLSPIDGRRHWVTADRGVDRPGGAEPADGRAMVLVSRDHLVLIGADGQASGFDVAIGGGAGVGPAEWEAAGEAVHPRREPAWTARPALGAVDMAAVADGRVILAGVGDGAGAGRGGSRSRRAGAPPMITALDVRTGETVLEPFRPPLADERVTWMQAGPLGTLVYGGDSGVGKINLRDGGLIWANRSYAVTQTSRGWRTGRYMAIEDRGGNLRRLHADTGLLGPTFDIPDHGGWEPLRLVDVYGDGDAFIARFRQRFVRYDINGNVIGADVLLGDRADEWVLRGDDRFVLISNLTDVGDGRFRLREQPVVYRVTMLSPNGQSLTEGADLTLPDLLEQIDSATVRDGWVLATAGEWTIALPAGAE